MGFDIAKNINLDISLRFNLKWFLFGLAMFNSKLPGQVWMKKSLHIHLAFFELSISFRNINHPSYLSEEHYRAIKKKIEHYNKVQGKHGI